MNAYPDFPSPPHWTAHDLAVAVPLRLFELYRSDADHADCPRAQPARDWRGGYVRPAPLPMRFCVHH